MSIGSSSGGFFFPRAVVNAVVNKKWNRRRDLVTSFGLGYNVAKDDHRDLSFSVGAAYYLRSPWIIEGGIRWNDSTPGAVLSQSQFIAITEGRNKKQVRHPPPWLWPGSVPAHRTGDGAGRLSQP